MGSSDPIAPHTACTLRFLARRFVRRSMCLHLQARTYVEQPPLLLSFTVHRASEGCHLPSAMEQTTSNWENGLVETTGFVSIIVLE